MRESTDMKKERVVGGGDLYSSEESVPDGNFRDGASEGSAHSALIRNRNPVRSWRERPCLQAAGPLSAPALTHFDADEADSSDRADSSVALQDSATRFLNHSSASFSLFVLTARLTVAFGTGDPKYPPIPKLSVTEPAKAGVSDAARMRASGPRQTVSTFMRFVLPGMSKGTPAVTTTRSP